MPNSTDWHEWHRGYEDASSDLSQRLATVRTELSRALAERAGRATQLVSICSGDGRDTLPVLAKGNNAVSTVLIEYDDRLAQAARHEADRLGLRQVDVRVADAGESGTYADVPRADVFMACGVFGNITDTDLQATVDALPMLMANDALLIWTRGPTGHEDPTNYDGHPGEFVREVLGERGFDELAFVRPGQDSFSVGVHRFVAEPRSFAPEGRIFTFVR